MLTVLCLGASLAMAQIPCDNMEYLPCDTTIYPSTCGHNDDLDEGCGLGDVDAQDRWWQADVYDDSSFTVELVCEWTDIVLWVMSDCDPGEWTCLEASNDNGPGVGESITYLNDTGSTQTVYFVIDGYEEDECDHCMVEITCNGAVPTEDRAWSTLKTLY